MTRLSITLLGAFETTREERPITVLKLSAARGLLAYLLLEAPAWCNRETLADLFWPEQLAARGLHSLRQALSRLRHALQQPGDPPFLEIERERIRCLPADDLYLDVWDFTQRITQITNWPPFNGKTLMQSPNPAFVSDFVLTALREAVEVYRGDFLSNLRHDSLPFEDWIRLQRERYHRQALEALYVLAAVYEAQGNYAQACLYARRQIIMESWREEAHQQLMRALAFSGQRSAALEQYQRCREILKTELGVEPAASATTLYERIRQGRRPPPTPYGAVPHNLPRRIPCRDEREADVRRLCVRLLDPAWSLVTLAGPEQADNARFALEAAARLHGSFPDGSWYVALNEQPASDLCNALAHTLNPYWNAALDTPEHVLHFLHGKTLLLILAGLSADAADIAFLGELLRRVPRIKVLVVAAQRLNLLAEHVFTV
ncbi:MAG: winged helix-turn-helix domain-containing protein [Anaerolineae bacterium]|nr:winged helix-turn-helix domain-containing protein [Anaerolineae bacterium]